MSYSLHSRAYAQRKWRAYRSFLRSEPSRDILKCYAEHGGEAARLRAFLWTLRERQIKAGRDPLPRLRVLSCPARGALERAAKSLRALLDDLEGEQIGGTLPRSCHATLTRLEDHMQWLKIQRRIKQAVDSIKDMTRPFRALIHHCKDQSLGRRGRGPTEETIAAAVLVEEFKRRTRRAHYEWALTLLHEAAPNVFKMDTEKGHGPEDLRHRVKRLKKENKEVVTRLHANIFS